MNMEKSDIIRDVYYILITFLMIFLILKIVFMSEEIMTVLKVAASIFWILVLPGFPLTYLYKKINFIERISLGTLLSASLMGIGSYYLGLLGIHVKYSMIYLPIIYISLTLLVMLIKSMKSKSQNSSNTLTISSGSM